MRMRLLHRPCPAALPALVPAVSARKQGAQRCSCAPDPLCLRTPRLQVNSLQDIYWRYEGFTCPQQEQAQQQQLAGAPPSLACSHPAEANNWQLAPPLRMPPPMPLRQPLMAAAGQQQATGQQQRSQGLGASACGDATPASMAAASHDPGSDSGADENCEMQLGH